MTPASGEGPSRDERWAAPEPARASPGTGLAFGPSESAPADSEPRHSVPSGDRSAYPSSEGPSVLTAAWAGLLVCQTCGQISRPAPARLQSICPRCGSELHARKPASLARTWAFLIAASILYIPANTLPVMRSSSLFGAQQDTIWSGIVFLWLDGSWFLAVLVFVASIVVPLAKLLVLSCLAISVQLGVAAQPRLRTRLYRAIEFVGRWSMLDIYVVTLLVGLVQLQSVAAIHAGPGAVAFGAVVVLTMLASLSFDPRLIWDAVDRPAPAVAPRAHLDREWGA
ncbi:paraquat-inducible protein A [Methylibium sp.]|uniref:paraquat-inducible protein A n=1 Tax=Methylibium sp. TaxID=2067992 RepID=UPI003D0C711B